MPIPAGDRAALRSLASRVREIAELPEMEERRRRLTALNTLRPERPTILVFPEGGWTDLVTADDCVCDEPLLRGYELALRRKVFSWERIRDDAAIDPWFEIGWVVSDTGYGVDIEYAHGQDRGSYRWKPPIEDLSRDMARLRHREFTVDRAETARRVELAESIFGDLLPVHIRGGQWWTVGLTIEAIKLVGLEGLMLFMFDDPEGLHGLMAWLRDDMRSLMDWAEREGLLTLNNRAQYVGSGGYGYTDELPSPGYVEGGPVRLIDRWGFGESQETVGVSPEMFAEFILPYQMPLLEGFGLNCYGCCEPVDKRLDYIMKVPRLRRLSVSPWADQAKVAERMGMSCVFSRKPNPAMVSAGFNEEIIRADLRATLAVAKDLPLEIILKDTHTFQGDASRPGRWTAIALEEVHRAIG